MLPSDLGYKGFRLSSFPCPLTKSNARHHHIVIEWVFFHDGLAFAFHALSLSKVDVRAVFEVGLAVASTHPSTCPFFSIFKFASCFILFYFIFLSLLFCLPSNPTYCSPSSPSFNSPPPCSITQYHCFLSGIPISPSRHLPLTFHHHSSDCPVISSLRLEPSCSISVLY